MIVVLHDVNIAARFCDDLIARSGGRFVAQETADQFMNADHLEAIYGIRMGIVTPADTGAPISYIL